MFVCVCPMNLCFCSYMYEKLLYCLHVWMATGKISCKLTGSPSFNKVFELNSVYPIFVWHCERFSRWWRLCYVRLSSVLLLEEIPRIVIHAYTICGHDSHRNIPTLSMEFIFETVRLLIWWNVFIRLLTHQLTTVVVIVNGTRLLFCFHDNGN